MKVYLSPKAQFQYQTLKGKNTGYAAQVKAILLDIKEHPLEGIGTPELYNASVPDLWERLDPVYLRGRRRLRGCREHRQ